MTVKRIDFSRKFEKNLKKAPKKIQVAFRKRLEMFLSDKFHPILNNHPLVGEYQNYRSINVTGDWRAVFREFQGGEVVYFDLLQTHSKLYG